MSDSWQTVPTKHRKWVSNSNTDADATATATASSPTPSAFAPKDKGQRPSFSSFGSRKSKDETNNRVMPSAFANKRSASETLREQDDQRRQWQARLERNAQQARVEEETTLREALTIESEKEYPSLQNSSSKKSSNSLLNFKAIVEAPASPNVPKITVIGGAKPAHRPATPPAYSPRYECEEDEVDDEEFNVHIGGRKRGGDAW